MDIKFTPAIISTFFQKTDNLGAERYRKAFISFLMNVVSQSVQVATGLISIPLTLNYVGVERFGIWMTLSTALTFITFSDFGVGIGVQDSISKFIGAENHDLARKAFFSSFLFVTMLFIVLMGLNYAIVPHIDLSSFLSLKSAQAIQEILPITQMVIFVLGIGLLAGIVQRTFNALQESFCVASIQVISRICSLFLLFIVVNLKMGLPALIFVVGGLSSAALLLIGLPILLMRHKWILPAEGMWVNAIDFSSLKAILKVGMLGLGASIAIYFVNNSIPMLIAKKHGVVSVADYAVLLKLMSIPGLLLTYSLLPLWPAITEAKVKNDNQWIKKTYKFCGRVTFILSLGFTAFFLIFGQDIIRLWTHNESVVPSFELLLASVVFMVLGFWNTLTTLILNGLSRYRGQATYGIVLSMLFVYLATLIPSHYGKVLIIYTIAAGYFLRCLVMQIELMLCFRANK